MCSFQVLGGCPLALLRHGNIGPGVTDGVIAHSLTALCCILLPLWRLNRRRMRVPASHAPPRSRRFKHHSFYSRSTSSTLLLLLLLFQLSKVPFPLAPKSKNTGLETFCKTIDDHFNETVTPRRNLLSAFQICPNLSNVLCRSRYYMTLTDWLL